ncbi:MAG: nucleoside hydrolase [Novosphingobium sp.]|nr:nucleoside hydrolase [Novosphingobium sp.]
MTSDRVGLDRRKVLVGGAGIVAASGLSLDTAASRDTVGPLGLEKPFAPIAGPRSRVLYINDVSGDPDGHFATVHQILSSACELRHMIGTDGGGPGETAQRSAALLRDITRIMGRAGSIQVHEGAAGKMPKAGAAVPSAGTGAIIEEALRADSSLPLFIAVGGGLTEVASAVLIEPRIADRFTLVWIGGDALPDGGTGETNFNIDPRAAQFLFNDTNVKIWQVPRAVYKTCLISATEIQAFIAPYGEIGAWLYDRLADLNRRFGPGFNAGETWTLGDNPLVLLTALQDWNPVLGSKGIEYGKTGSSEYDEIIAPRFNADGTYSPQSDGRKIRIYRSIDTRMMFNDFFAKMLVNYR